MKENGGRCVSLPPSNPNEDSQYAKRYYTGWDGET